LSKIVPPVPPLDFNLFRTPSVYSIDSLTSLSTFSHEDEPPPDRPETPTTPRARPADLGPPIQSPTNSRLASGNITPKRSFVVTSRQPVSPTSPRSVQTHFQLRPVPGRSQLDTEPIPHDVPLPAQPVATNPNADWTSIHGEQGSDWGEDEAQFEWLDTSNAPEALNGTSNGWMTMSPSKRLLRLKAAVKPSLSVGHGEGKKLRKQLVFPRRAAPPPPVEDPPPTRSLSINKPPESPLRPRRPEIISQTVPGRHLAPPPLTSRWSDGPSSHTPPPTDPGRLSPLMVPLEGDDSLSPKPKNLSRNSQMSFQSMAYSFYDIQGDADPPSTPTAHQIGFPHGKYLKVSVSSLEKEEMRERSMSDPQLRRGDISPDLRIHGRTAEGLVNAGIEARGKGDLPKAVWYFMKAAEGGSVTGRMYWGRSDFTSQDRADVRRACT